MKCVYCLYAIPKKRIPYSLGEGRINLCSIECHDSLVALLKKELAEL